MYGRPEYHFVKKQIKGVKGWEPHYDKGSGWPESLGFFKTKKEAREAVQRHKDTQLKIGG